jgi:hypothetical protein
MRAHGRLYTRYDGARIRLPGARAEINAGAARRVWDGALCAQVDPELFFPEQGGDPRPARAVCLACPVRALCLDTFGPVVDHGVVGGLTEVERRRRRHTRAGVA